jgi:hypothetical protein
MNDQMFSKFYTQWSTTGAQPKGGGRGGAATQIEVHKKRHAADTMISIVLRDLPFSQNQPLKTADDLCIAIVKNKT